MRSIRRTTSDRLKWAESAPTASPPKARSPRSSRHSIGSAKKASPPEVGINGLPASGGMQRLRAASCILREQKAGVLIKAEMPMTARHDLQFGDRSGIR